MLNLRSRLEASLAHRTSHACRAYLNKRRSAELAQALGRPLDRAAGPDLDHLDLLCRIRDLGAEVDCVFDIGAHRGRFCWAADLVLQPSRIVAVEPNRELHQAIERSCPRAERLGVAVSDGEGVQEFYLHAADSMSSLLPVSEAYFSKFTWETPSAITARPVPVTTLGNLIDRYGEGAGHLLLKLDTQGNEYQILKAGEPILSRVAVAVVEYMFWEGYVGQQPFSSLIALLARHGLDLAFVSSVSFAVGNGCADFVFARRTEL